MERLFQFVSRVNKVVGIVTKCSLAFIVLITVADVILRSFRRPIVGTYELVAFSGAVAMGFSIPLTSWEKKQIQVDFIIMKFSQMARRIIKTVTKSLGIGLFLMIGWNVIVLGNELRRAGEVSFTLELPFYVVAYGIGICCLLQCLVLLCDIMSIFGGKHE
jgi:TRAP-type C4-dicarboxylate transport system permease small subunit